MLAIVIPYYKISFFEATLQSLEYQTDKRFKVYIGDDNSSENPTCLLKKYEGKFDFQYHKFNENLGGTSLVKHWERCIDLAETQSWIMILGDDDYLDETVIDSWYKQYNNFNRKANVIRFASRVVDEKLQTISGLYTHNVLEKPSDSYYNRFKGYTRSSLSEHVFLKQAYQKYRFTDYPVAWHSDDKAWLDFSEDKPIYSINESAVFIRMSAINISGKKEYDVVKNDATSKFLKDVLRQKLNDFNKAQRLELMLYFEEVTKRTRKLSSAEWRLILKLYFINFKFVPFFKSWRRLFITIVSK